MKFEDLEDNCVEIYTLKPGNGFYYFKVPYILINLCSEIEEKLGFGSYYALNINTSVVTRLGKYTKVNKAKFKLETE
jgi:hypothetical protein